MAREKIAVMIVPTILLACGVAVTPAFVNQEKNLLESLLGNYGSRTIRPLQNASRSLNVTMRLLIAQIVDFNEPRQQLTVNAWQKVSWRDEFLVWEPDDYGGQNVLHLLPTDIWVPRLVLVENVNFNFHSVGEIELIVSPDGEVTWYAPVMFQFSCKVYVRKFPFDIQHCNLTLQVWSYDVSSVNLWYFDDEDSKQTVFSKNGVWNLVGVAVSRVEQKFACCEHPYALIVYTLTFQRASLFYIFSILIPSALLAMITLLVFRVPPESGEKISLGMTNLLAFVLFQQLIASSMPPLGDETPILTIYIFSMVVVGCASIFVSVLVLRLFHTTSEKTVPRKVVDLMACWGCQEHQVTWQAVALMLDRVMFIMFLVATLCIIVLSYIALAVEHTEHL